MNCAFMQNPPLKKKTDKKPKQPKKTPKTNKTKTKQNSKTKANQNLKKKILKNKNKTKPSKSIIIRTKIYHVCILKVNIEQV